MTTQTLPIRLLSALKVSTDSLRSMIPGFAGVGLSMRSSSRQKEKPRVDDYVVEVLVKNALVNDARLAAGETVTLNVEDEGEVTLRLKIQSAGRGQLEENRKQPRHR